MDSIEAEYIAYMEDSISTEIAYIDSDPERMKIIISQCVDSGKEGTDSKDKRNDELADDIKSKITTLKPEGLKDFKECIQNAK